MHEDLIQLPDLVSIKEMLEVARRDINQALEEDRELLPMSHLLTKVIDIIEEKISVKDDFSTFSQKEKIELAAHLHFLQGLLEDFFYFEEDSFDDEEDFEEDEFERN